LVKNKIIDKKRKILLLICIIFIITILSVIIINPNILFQKNKVVYYRGSNCTEKYVNDVLITPKCIETEIKEMEEQSKEKWIKNNI